MDCEKEAFGSRHAARAAVARRKRFGNKRFRQYWCSACKAYHNSTGRQVGKVDRGEWNDD